MATPEEEIPLAHLPLDVLRGRIARREAVTSSPPPPPARDGGVDALLASVGLRAGEAPVIDLEPLRGELARRLTEGRERARQRAALYRAHRSVGLLEYRGALHRAGLERFIAEAGERLGDETGAPPIYLLVPPRIYARQLSAVYNVWGAAIAGQPLVVPTPFGPLKVAESDLVGHITLV